jgi:ACS family hexuronate transporter-like MFS transporter
VVKILGYKQTWAFAIGKFLTDPVWWFYLFWLPDFLESQYHLTITEISVPVALVYMLSTVGSVGGGLLPLVLIRRSWPVFQARKISMLVFACYGSPYIIFTISR